MLRKYLVFAAILLLPICSKAAESQACATTTSDLRAMLGDPNFPLKWEETSMGDGKPLRVSILEKDENLFLTFTKDQEGLWAKSTSIICRAGTHLEAKFTSEQIQLGPAANWFLRQALRGGGKFTLTKIVGGKLKIATSGWSGDFIPSIK
jgi:hypothetical protein